MNWTLGAACLLAAGIGARDLEVRISRDDGSGGQVVVRGRLDAPVERVWRVLADHQAYPRIFPEIRRMTFLRRSARGSVWRAEVTLPWPLGQQWTEEEVEARRGSLTVTWRHLAGSIRDNSGSWQLRAAPGGGTAVVYRNRFDPGTPLLPQWLVTWAVAIGIPKVVDDLRRYVAEAR